MRFLFMFMSLIFVKCFHWIGQDRIDFMEQSPVISMYFHVRMIALLGASLLVDIAFVSYSIQSVLYTPNMMLIFAFEFTILATSMMSSIVKYTLNIVDASYTDPWENKSIYSFYLELVSDFLKLIIYFAFFIIILTFYGLPLHIVRDVYVTMRSFLRKLNSFIQYRRATHHMNERYPDATRNELDNTGDQTCIICREQMLYMPPGDPVRTQRLVPKRLRCGHVLHFHCLRAWLERQQSCPTCRRSVLDPDGLNANDSYPPPRPAEGPYANPLPSPTTTPNTNTTNPILASNSDGVETNPLTLPSRLSATAWVGRNSYGLKYSINQRRSFYAIVN